MRSGASGELLPLPKLDAPAREKRARPAARIPLATIGEDTRYVLQGHLSRPLLSRRAVEFPSDGQITYPAELGDLFPGSGHLALLPFLRLDGEWKSLPGQYSHPHPLTDPGGQWISFTSARDGPSDVFVVDARS